MEKVEEFLEDMRMEGKAEGTLREYKRRLERVPLTTIQYLLGHKSLGMTAHYAQSALVDLSDLTDASHKIF